MKTAYANLLFELTDADLLNELERSVRSNSYGSHSEQIEMIRDEIMTRMGR